MHTRILLLAAAVATMAGCRASAVDTPAAPPPPSCPTFELARQGLPESGEWRTHPSVADIDRDGLDDVALLPRKLKGPHVLLSDGLGGWNEASEGLEYETGFSCGIGTRLLDVLGDDHLDLVVADHCEGLRVYRGDGGSTWTDASRGIPRNFGGINDAAVGDLDGDGLPEIVAISAFTRGMFIVSARRGSNWELVHDTGLPEIGGGMRLRLHDVNLDSRLDIVSTYNFGGEHTDDSAAAKVWLQQPDGRFAPARGIDADGRFFGVAIAPRPGREIPDLIFSRSGWKASILRYESNDGETWSLAGRVDEGWTEHHPGFPTVETVDIDNDGCLDLIGHETQRATVFLAMGDCAGNWAICPDETLLADGEPAPGWGVAAGDFNGDGLTDVIASYARAGGRMLAWLQKGNAP